MIILRAVKEFTSCTSIEQTLFEQTLFKQIVTGDEVLALSSSLSLEEVAVYVHCRVL